MKKVLLMLAIIFSIGIVNAKTIEAGKKTDYYYSRTKMIVKEVMKQYYMRGEIYQYNGKRPHIPPLPPEDATVQDRQFTGCSNYRLGIFHEAFGMLNGSFTYGYMDHGVIIGHARSYYKKMKNGEEASDGHYLLYYENTTDNAKAKYVYNYKNTDNVDFKEFAKILQPGDIITYKSATSSGHDLVIYDFVRDKKTLQCKINMCHSACHSSTFF